MKDKLLVVALILFSFYSFGQSGKTDKNFKKGTEAYESGNYKEAVSFYTLSINDRPTSNSFFNRALAYYKLLDSCNFCNDLKHAANFGDEDSKKLYLENCIYTMIDTNIPDSVKLYYPNADHYEISFAMCSSDSVVRIISKKDDKSWSDDICEFGLEPVYTIIEVMPCFVGGDEARNKYIADNIKYPEKALANIIQGTVYVSFIIEKDGSVTNVKVLRGIGGGCDEESVRIIKQMPKWTPGTQNGKPRRVLFNMPIYYKLSGLK
ncbi:MAG: energy transducer TonB [Bacteroidota bacterium]